MLDTRLALIDQGSFLGLRALGHQPIFQGTWFYDRGVDLDALGRFNESLANTLVGRLIDTSPLPFGRHRWVGLDAVPPIEVETAARDRSDVTAWLDEVALRPVDPEHGPGWRFAVLPLTDGGTVVTLYIPHALGDGLCKLQAIADAVRGDSRGPRYPLRETGGRFKRFFADLWSSIREIPTLGKALIGLVKAARSVTGSDAGTSAKTLPAPAPHPYSEIRVVGVMLDQGDWDAAAAALGGTSNTLVQAFAAALGQRIGRVGADGKARLAIPVSVRTDNDTRANALDSVTVPIDPTGLSGDIRPLRAATKKALEALANSSHAMLAALPLTPYLPIALVRKTEALAMGSNDVPIGCSNYGDVDADLARIDGSDASYFAARVVEPGMEPADYDRIGGSLYVLSGRLLGRIFLSANVYKVGAALTDAEVQAEIDSVLAQFGLSEVERVF